RAQTLGRQGDAGVVAERLFSRNTDGSRVIGLALARIDPRRQHIELALPGIRLPRSPFEQFHALLLADVLLSLLHPTAAVQLEDAIGSQINHTIRPDDQSRWAVARRLLETIRKTTPTARRSEPEIQTHQIQELRYPVIRVTSASPHVRYDDPEETHGPWVKTLGAHFVTLPEGIHLGRYLVTNEEYLAFVRSGGYSQDEFWTLSPRARRRFTTAD